MVILLVVVHVIVCLFLIGVVLLQQGKSAIIFMLTSIALTVVLSHSSAHRSVLSDVPASQSLPKK